MTTDPACILLLVDKDQQAEDLRALEILAARSSATPVVLIAGTYGEQDAVTLRDRVARDFPGTSLQFLEPAADTSSPLALDIEIYAQAIREAGAAVAVCNSPAISSGLEGALSDSASAKLNTTQELPNSLGSASNTHERDSDATAAAATKPTLALVTPWVPQITGIARHAVVMHDALSSFYDITVVASGEYEATPGVEFIAPTEFANRTHEFDRILYQMGNSPFHEFILPLLKKSPGVVVMHDAQFTEWFRPTRGEDSPEFRSLCYQEGGLRGWLEGSMTGVDLIRPSLGAIVHSRNAWRRLTSPPAALVDDFVSCAALVDVAAKRPTRAEARAALGLSDETVLISTFGRVHDSKRSLEFVEAAVAAGIEGVTDPTTRIAVVGAPADEEYMARVEACASKHVTVTGELNGDEFSNWVAATDIAVQLRSEDHGESSAALIEAMAGGAAVLVEDVGAMSEILDGTGVVLETPLDPANLVDALRQLIDDPVLRNKLARESADLAVQRHSASAAARQYREIIEYHYLRRSPARLIAGLSNRSEPLEQRRDAVTRAAANRIDRASDRLVIELTEIIDGAAVSGIQRVEERLGQNLINSWPGRTLHAAATAQTLEETVAIAERSAAVEVTPPKDLGRLEGRPGDWLFSAQFFPDVDLWRDRTDRWRSRGGRVAHLVHDLFPVTNQEWFPDYAVEHFPNYLNLVLTSSDLVVTNSKATLEQLVQYLENGSDLAARKRALDLSWVRLGFDIDAPEAQLPPATKSPGEPRVLLVGTVEPRKGYSAAVKAVEELWNRGSNVKVTIIGRRGWGTDELFAELATAASDNDHLTWLDDCSDAELKQAYTSSDLLLAASENEGFGLPLIEAANYGLPVLARDIPVFHEVAGASARYFNDASPHALADAILNALDQGPTNEPAPPSTTWRDAADQVVASLNGERVLARWEPASGVKWL